MPSPAERKAFVRISKTSLDAQELAQAREPQRLFPEQIHTFATHWHPENVPLHCIAERLKAMYPNEESSLIIPTQHNEIMAWGDFAGVEVDCFDASFGQKVQLLLHFRADKVEENKAHTLRTMLADTADYRAYQLLDLLTALEERKPSMIEQAAKQSEATKKVINTVADAAVQLRLFVDQYIQEESVHYRAHICKNKLIRNYLDAVQPLPKPLMPVAQRYVQLVKKQVKKSFDYSNLYPVHSIIEEARGLGAGIVIPHPEVFWPVLVAGYVIDGIEVWNPCSCTYTTFLMDMIGRHNAKHAKQMLPFMGDDCHMAEKTRPLAVQDAEKAAREIGLQPWGEPAIAARLASMKMSKESIMAEYRQRLMA